MHTAVRGSGRVGPTASGCNLEEQALSAAVAAAVRHRHTKYDELLASGMDRASARERVGDRVGNDPEAGGANFRFAITHSRSVYARM